jgi:hypothetical protein
LPLDTSDHEALQRKDLVDQLAEVVGVKHADEDLVRCGDACVGRELPLYSISFLFSSYLGVMRTLPTSADPLHSDLVLAMARQISSSSVLMFSAFSRASAIAYCRLVLKELTLTVSSRKSCRYSASRSAR